MTDPDERVLWEEAMEQVKKGQSNGPFQFDEEGRIATVGCPQTVSPAFGFGAQQGQKLRAVDDLKRCQTNRAAAIETPVNLPIWGHFSATIRTFRESGVQGNLSMAKADHKDA